MDKKPLHNEILKDLINRISWCLSQYSPEEHPDQSSSQAEEPPKSVLNWSPLKTLKNNLHYFLGNADSEQASAVAALLIYVIGKASSDLTTNTPWDNVGLLENAWLRTQNSILILLRQYKAAIELTSEETDKILWQAFRKFEKDYNDILVLVDKEDMATITERHSERESEEVKQS